MGKRKKKIPASATSRKESKQIKIAKIQHSGKPCWRFSSVDKGGPFKWPVDANEQHRIISKLHSFDSMPWAEITGKQHHYLSASSLSKEARKRLEELELDDNIDNLFSFSLGGRPRFICIRLQDVAILLWNDPCHQVAPSRLKNT